MFSARRQEGADFADDAKDAAHVRPLLPPPGYALLVTSRNRFSLPGMTALDLGTLSPREAAKLLLEICPRIGEHAAKLAKLCGYLPLALRISASLLANSSRGVEHYLEQLAAERLRHPSDPDDPAASVEASLRLSYDALEPSVQAALGQVSVFPASFDPAAALAVVEIEGDAEALLDLLQRRSLLEWDTKLERYGLHELVRVFAAVLLRYAHHYAQVADRTRNLYHQGGAALLAALALFDLERVHIDAGWGWARERAGEEQADTLLLDYADATVYVGDLRYDKRRERIPQIEAQLAAAQRLKQRDAEGAALGNLGNAYADLGEARRAISFYEQALVIAREIGDRRGEGAALGNLGVAYKNLGEARKAISFYEQRLEIAREIGDRRGEARTSWNLGLALEKQGNLARAVAAMQVCVDFERDIGHPNAEAHAARLEQCGNGSRAVASRWKDDLAGGDG